MLDFIFPSFLSEKLRFADISVHFEQVQGWTGRSSLDSIFWCAIVCSVLHVVSWLTAFLQVSECVVVPFYYKFQIIKVVVFEGEKKKKSQICTYLCQIPQFFSITFPFALPLVCAYIYMYTHIIYSMESKKNRIWISERCMNAVEARVLFSLAKIL